MAPSATVSANTHNSINVDENGSPEAGGQNTGVSAPKWLASLAQVAAAQPRHGGYGSRPEMRVASNFEVYDCWARRARGNGGSLETSAAGGRGLGGTSATERDGVAGVFLQ